MRRKPEPFHGQSARLEHTRHFGDERCPLCWWHVMQNAHGERNVEALLAERDAFAVVELELASRKVLGGTLHHARRNVDTVELAKVLADVARHEPDATTNI